MLLNISSDRIIYNNAQGRSILPYWNLEKSIADFLYSEYSGIKDPSSSYEIVVINGPGSFTNLRIVTLALNTFSVLNGGRIKFYSIDKITRYVDLYKQNKIPRYCLMYIWQKNNFWLVDLQRAGETSLQEYIKEVKKIHTADLYAEIEKVRDEIFLDEMVAEWLEMVTAKLVWLWDIEMSTFAYDQEAVKRFWLKLTDLIEPLYLIDANIQS